MYVIFYIKLGNLVHTFWHIVANRIERFIYRTESLIRSAVPAFWVEIYPLAPALIYR